MKLYYSATSPYVRKVLIAAIERGLDDRIERLPTDGFGEEHRPANPLAKVPALVPDDGGPALYDSIVICDHLDRIGDAPRLIPEGGSARDRVLRIHALGQGMTDAALLLQVQRVRERKSGQPLPDDWWHERQRQAIHAGADALEAEMGALEGEIDLGQISVATALGYLDLRFDELQWRQGREKLAAWYETFAARPSMAATAPPPA
ncbi:glutathione S-transferase N-terminal domain-containing protein [Marivibrio halodurans]|uniref:Glutathione S-transferase N-terminal domain-containing protein n=1 Tax=Marivibrio halodurans TaxID=2039722 RepID=A0A8J7SNW8_9PROT|nr:glutathione S-transferase N-terminal domain-containing protein [Marivibrio halodurans]